MTTNPFDYVKDILGNKTDIIRNAENPAEMADDYAPFIANKALSFYIDLIMFANEMNLNSSLPKDMQFNYLLNTVKSKKRPYSPWVNKSKSATIDLIQELYSFNSKKAEAAANIITDVQVKVLKKIKEQRV